ncbi:MAG: hypothetical protein KAY37_05755 [Phycisphaerae bacterium]|nr:hypothetical protein [Phycisphaerae bacterium]
MRRRCHAPTGSCPDSPVDTLKGTPWGPGIFDAGTGDFEAGLFGYVFVADLREDFTLFAAEFDAGGLG